MIPDNSLAVFGNRQFNHLCRFGIWRKADAAAYLFIKLLQTGNLIIQFVIDGFGTKGTAFLKIAGSFDFQIAQQSNNFSVLRSRCKNNFTAFAVSGSGYAVSAFYQCVINIDVHILFGKNRKNKAECRSRTVSNISDAGTYGIYYYVIAHFMILFGKI